MTPDVIIIGGGAAGMMAAVAAADRGQQVLLLEKMNQAGLKLRITGKGRCNLTNTAPLKDFLTHVGSDGRFLRNCMSRFYNQELMDFFSQRGVPLVEERGKRVFPQSGKSLDIFLALINDLEHRPNVEIRKNCAVRNIETTLDTDGVKLVSGVRLQSGETISAQRVILATGGLSYPLTGATGAGYRWAAELGHTVIPPVPSLVALRCSQTVPRELEGFVLKNVALRIRQADGKPIFDQQGEMTFFEDGISGPIVLSASRIVSRTLHNGTPLEALVDLKPAITAEVLDHRLINDLNANGTRIFNDALRLWMPAELIPFALTHLHIEYYKRLNQINGNERKRLLAFLKGMPLTLTGTHDFNEAITTQGGVCLNEINPKTMESKLVKGLHIVGEVLDLDADTGGYNLQIAFSTGWTAGNAS
ncbi:MAG: NAD(P)/FAD-dependent oxidoreductase [Bacteroidales bacterium]|nr:NAD(P)/FAD-dependent oxidoreductase [Candidatus Colimorpha onthohippi]